MTTIMPKPRDSREKRLQRLGQVLNDASPKDREEAIKIAGKLLAIKARKKG